MWDNTDTKQNPNQPDYKCKNRGCGNAIWLDNKTRNAAQGVAQQTGAPQAQRVLVLDSLFSACFDAAVVILEQKVKAGKVENFTTIDAVAAAGALLMARTHGALGILKMEKDSAAERARKAEEERKRREEEERQRQQQAGGAPVQSDDDLPF